MITVLLPFDIRAPSTIEKSVIKVWLETFRLFSIANCLILLSVQVTNLFV